MRDYEVTITAGFTDARFGNEVECHARGGGGLCRFFESTVHGRGIVVCGIQRVDILPFYLAAPAHASRL